MTAWTGGKGSSPRPFSVSDEEYANNVTMSLTSKLQYNGYTGRMVEVEEEIL
jgi:hypothetical protein